MQYPITIDEVLQENMIRLKKYYSGKKVGLNRFGTFSQFSLWYQEQMKQQNYSCHYCSTSLLVIRQLLNYGIIKGRKVRGNAERGGNFEIDRKDPFGFYEPENCVLCCYYCNNDKSNTFSYKQYAEIIGPTRQQVFLSLQKLINRS